MKYIYLAIFYIILSISSFIFWKVRAFGDNRHMQVIAMCIIGAGFLIFSNIPGLNIYLKLVLKYMFVFIIYLSIIDAACIYLNGEKLFFYIISIISFACSSIIDVFLIYRIGTSIVEFPIIPVITVNSLIFLVIVITWKKMLYYTVFAFMCFIFSFINTLAVNILETNSNLGLLGHFSFAIAVILYLVGVMKEAEKKNQENIKDMMK